MKTKCIVIFMLICLMLCINTFAETVVMDSDRVIKVEGKTNGSGKTVNILVLSPGATPETAETDASLRQYVGEVVSDENGNYKKLIKLNTASLDISGEFLVYIGGDSFASPSVHRVYIATANEKIESAILVATCSEQDIPANLVEKKLALALDIDIINSIDFVPLAKKLKVSLLNNPIQFDEDNLTSVANFNSLNELQLRIKEFALIECYNQGKQEVVFNDEAVIRYDEITKFSQMDNAHNINIYNLYSNKLTQTGKNMVHNYLMNKSVSSTLELKRLFADAVMFYGIKYNIDGGFGHVSNYINADNLMFAGNVTEENIGMPTYLNMTEKSTVNLAISRNIDSFTIENYKAKIEEYAKKESNVDNGGYTPSNGNSDNGKTTKIIISPNATAPIADNAKPEETVFEDLQDSLWAKDAILFLNKMGVINGVENKKFSPSEGLTREQAAKIICLAFNIDVNLASVNFSDVEDDKWYANYIRGAAKAGIINGISGDVFGIGQMITRQDLAVMLYRALGKVQISGELKFSDAEKIDSYAKDAVNYLNSIGLISGYDDNSFKPNNIITRAEAAKLFYAVMNKGE